MQITPPLEYDSRNDFRNVHFKSILVHVQADSQNQVKISSSPTYSLLNGLQIY